MKLFFDGKYMSDMAVDNLEDSDVTKILEKICKKEMLDCKIEKTIVNLSNESNAKVLGREKGVYITLEAKSTFWEAIETKKTLVKALANSIKQLSMKFSTTRPKILVVGLGNQGLIADSLGPKVVDGLIVTRHIIQNGNGKDFRSQISTLTPSVLGKTGIETFDVVKSVVEKIEPDFVIIVDTLCTSKVHRLYKSFQISTAGITPSSAIQSGRKALSFSSLQKPVISIGVPMLANIKDMMNRLFFDCLKSQNIDFSKFSFDEISDNIIKGKMICATKEIDFAVSECADVISKAINLAFLGKTSKDSQ